MKKHGKKMHFYKKLQGFKQKKRKKNNNKAQEKTTGLLSFFKPR